MKFAIIILLLAVCYLFSSPLLSYSNTLWLFGDQSNLFARKMGHVVWYAIVFNIILFCIKGEVNKAGWYALFGTLIVAGLDETNQLFEASRGGSIYDFMLDATGISLAAMCNYLQVIGRKK